LSLLDEILARKRAELASGRAPGLAPELADAVARLGPRAIPRVEAILARRAGAPLRLMAEVKFASPSAGSLSRKLDAGERALAYAAAGASLVSVLCDATFFGGGYGDLARARLALEATGRAAPILAKEFVVDPLQLDWARACGADAALLIARVLPPRVLVDLSNHARAIGLEPLVEVSTEAERDAALEAGARVVGVNARDLDTLEMDADRAARILAGVPSGCVAVHLSGLASPAAVQEVARGRADAALIGEALMREDDPGPLLGSMLSAAGWSG
jgi:indole-3-glycerol phosphate synthase